MPRYRKPAGPAPRAGLTDVARAARVSIATVSRATNSPDLLDKDTMQRVKRAMEKLDYTPNRVARRLRQRTGPRHLIGLMVPEIENPHFAEIVRGVEDAAYEQAYAVMLCNSDNNDAKQQFYLDLLRAESVDGIIIPPIHDRDPSVLGLTGLPVVAIDRRLRGSSFDSVRVDNRLGARLAMEHLLARGHRAIAHIAGPRQNPTSMERLEAWRESLAAHRVDCPASLLWQGNNLRDGGVAGAEALLSLRKRPTAVFVCNCMMALGVLEVVNRMGLSVPGDVAVVGYDDPPWAQALRPALTAIRQPAREMGRMAVELLLRRLNSPGARPEHRILIPELMIRQSS
jgi:LacI family transcriptional regulator/LacI family repressor for deo operon, udp, cdd, tsx, nupC, and nupG